MTAECPFCGEWYNAKLWHYCTANAVTSAEAREKAAYNQAIQDALAALPEPVGPLPNKKLTGYASGRLRGHDAALEKARIALQGLLKK